MSSGVHQMLRFLSVTPNLLSLLGVHRNAQALVFVECPEPSDRGLLGTSRGHGRVGDSACVRQLRMPGSGDGSLLRWPLGRKASLQKGWPVKGPGVGIERCLWLEQSLEDVLGDDSC